MGSKREGATVGWGGDNCQVDHMTTAVADSVEVGEMGSKREGATVWGGMVGRLDSSLLQVGISNVGKVGETGNETEGALLGGQSVIDQVMA